jgi:translocation and assembly module TamB
VNLTLQQSTLSNSPLWGVRETGGRQAPRVGADVDLHVGANVVAARGAFGAGGDTPQLAHRCAPAGRARPGFRRRAARFGQLSGTMDTPSLSATLEGQNLRLLGTHSLKSLRANANLGSGRGAPIRWRRHPGRRVRERRHPHRASEPAEQRHARRAHAAAAARGQDFDASTRSARRLERQCLEPAPGGAAEPRPLRLDAGGAGAAAHRRRARRRRAGLAKPEQLAFNGAVIRLPAGTVTCSR